MNKTSRNSEAFMVHPLIRIPKLPEPFPIERVMTAELADLLAKTAGRRQIFHSHLRADAPGSPDVALDDGKPSDGQSASWPVNRPGFPTCMSLRNIVAVESASRS